VVDIKIVRSVHVLASLTAVSTTPSA
jgi:hypothetical protein